MLNGIFFVSITIALMQFITESFNESFNEVINSKTDTNNTNNKEGHRNSKGQIIIENSKLYDFDCMMFGAYQSGKWAEEGKYNLNAEELKKENERIESHFKRLYELI